MKISAGCAAIAMFAPTAKAMSEVDLFQHILKNASPARESSDVTCTNFSGIWKGSCVTQLSGGTTTRKDDLAIEQHGCHRIDIGGRIFYVGGSHIETDTSQDGSVWTNVVYTNWDSGKTTILNSIQASTRDADVTQFNAASANFSGTMKLLDGKLVTEKKLSVIALPNGVTTSPTIKVTCTYEKESL